MKLIKKRSIDQLAEKFDIEVEDTHNYIVNDIVVHNCNARFVWTGGRMWCGSRKQWKSPNYPSVWWDMTVKYPQIVTFCETYPDCVLYGEVYGVVQNLKYGHKQGEISFAAFDILNPSGQGWVPNKSVWCNPVDMYEACLDAMIPTVPIIHERYEGWTWDELFALADRRSAVPGADHIAEGVVIRPIEERRNPKFGRIQLKIVSNAYLEKKA